MSGSDWPRRAVLAAAAALAACSSTGGIRPRYTALPQSEMLTANRAPDQLIEDLAATLRTAGLRVARQANNEGYLETQWYDVETRTATQPPFNHLDRVVKMRFFADPVQGRTILLAECVQRLAWDPSRPERELERVVPAGHPGLVLMDSLIAAFRLDTTRTGGPPLPERH